MMMKAEEEKDPLFPEPPPALSCFALARLANPQSRISVFQALSEREKGRLSHQVLCSKSSGGIIQSTFITRLQSFQSIRFKGEI